MATFNQVKADRDLAGVRQFRTVPFPGSGEGDGVNIAVRALSENELDGCRVQAQIEIRKVASARQWTAESLMAMDPDYHSRLIERSIVARAFFDASTVDSESPVPFFSGEEDVRLLSSTTHQRLFDLYLEHQEWISPRLELGEDMIAEFATNAAGTEASLARLSQRNLVALCVAIAAATHTEAAGK